MKIETLTVENFRPFRRLEEMRVGGMTTIVGKNDSGKSSILRALYAFLEKMDLEPGDVHDKAGEQDPVSIEIAFSDLPETIEIEEGVETTLENELLLDKDGFLRMRKTFRRSNLTKASVEIIAQDFDDDDYADLCSLKEKDLNARCNKLGIEAKKAGRSITNREKRGKIRELAGEKCLPKRKRAIALETKSNLWKCVQNALPTFLLFEADTRLGVGETSFQSQFRPIVTATVGQDRVKATRDALETAIREGLQAETDRIYQELSSYTDQLSGLTVRPEFLWDKAVRFDVYGKDGDGVEVSLERRGAGIRRLLMVAFFRYMAARKFSADTVLVFAVEGPETFLHPGLQRDLVSSFRRIVGQGHQVIITSHSPVFAGASPLEDLALVTRVRGIARAKQGEALHLEEVAEEMGVDPSDQICGYKACVFVEGPYDRRFWTHVTSQLAKAGRVDSTLSEKGIGIVLTGGDNLKHWVNSSTMHKLNRKFAVIVDSDLRSKDDTVAQRKLNWKEQCERDGGKFFILKKREIENYLHLDAIMQLGGFNEQPYCEFTDMKFAFGSNVITAVKHMSADRILEMDSYKDDQGKEHHELVEIIAEILEMVPS